MCLCVCVCVCFKVTLTLNGVICIFFTRFFFSSRRRRLQHTRAACVGRHRRQTGRGPVASPGRRCGLSPVIVATVKSGAVTGRDEGWERGDGRAASYEGAPGNHRRRVCVCLFLFVCVCVPVNWCQLRDSSPQTFKSYGSNLSWIYFRSLIVNFCLSFVNLFVYLIFTFAFTFCLPYIYLFLPFCLPYIYLYPWLLESHMINSSLRNWRKISCAFILKV